MGETSRPVDPPARRLHIICERDTGLFSHVQQVIANIPWALLEHRIPIAYFREKTCYWTPHGYAGQDTVWEYYFEPVIPACPAASIPQAVRTRIADRHPSPFDAGYAVDDDIFVSSNFGDHPDLCGKTLVIPYLAEDPDDAVRRAARPIVERYVRPRRYLLEKANTFTKEHLVGRPVIGVHVRGTDAISRQELRRHRRGSLVLPRYVTELRRLLAMLPTAKILVATDDEASLTYLTGAFGSRVVTYGTIRHRGGAPAGQGPTGWIMPAYIAGDRDRAARNGEEAVIEYLLLSRCCHLVHNGSSLARTVLLNAPELPHTNTHHAGPQHQATPHHLVITDLTLPHPSPWDHLEGHGVTL
jgi:hypothetical protein